MVRILIFITKMTKKISISSEDFINLNRAIGSLEAYFTLSHDDIGIDNVKVVESVINKYITL